MGQEATGSTLYGPPDWFKIEKQEQKNQPSWPQIILQSYNHQDSMVLAHKQKYRPMEQDINPRNKPMQIWVPYY